MARFSLRETSTLILVGVGAFLFHVIQSEIVAWRIQNNVIKAHNFFAKVSLNLHVDVHFHSSSRSFSSILTD